MIINPLPMVAKIIKEKLSVSQIMDLRKKVFIDSEKNKVKELIFRACAGNIGYIVQLSKNIKFMCGIDSLDEKFFDKVQHEINQITEIRSPIIVNTPIIPKLRNYMIPTEIYDQFSGKINYDRINKLSKLIYDNSTTHELTENEISELLTSLGNMNRGYAAQKEYNNINIIRQNQKNGQIQIIINILNRLILYFNLIKISSDDLLINSESMEWFVEFIFDKDSKDFIAEIPPFANNRIYNKINYANIPSEAKVIILLNIFSKLIEILMQPINPIMTTFFMQFLFHIKNDLDVVDLTIEDIQEIEFKQENLRRKRTEKFLKMTPEEKLIQGFLEAKLEEQIELLDEEQKEAAQNEIEELIDTYNPEEELKNIDAEEEAESFDEGLYEEGTFDAFINEELINI